MLPPPPSPPRSSSPGDETATGSTVGEAFAIAPDTYVVPGWWPFPGAGLGLPLGTLVVRGQATAVVDTAPAPLEDDWLAAVLALVDPAEVRWIVATAPDAVRTGCLDALHQLAPRATVVVPGSGCTLIDLGRGDAIRLHEHPPEHAPEHAPEHRLEHARRDDDRADGAAVDLRPGPATVPGQIVASLPHRRLLWTDLVGGAFTRPVADVATVDDDTLVTALARRSRALGPDEMARTAALDLRVLGSPVGPIARGPSIARVLRLARVAEARRGEPRLSLDPLLGPRPWVGPVITP